MSEPEHVNVAELRAIVRSARAEYDDFYRALQEAGIHLDPMGFANSRLVGLEVDLSRLEDELGIRES